jgi:hypothetical protein
MWPEVNVGTWSRFFLVDVDQATRSVNTPKKSRAGETRLGPTCQKNAPRLKPTRRIKPPTCDSLKTGLARCGAWCRCDALRTRTLPPATPNVIMQDYLLTNTYSAASIAATYNSLKAGYGQNFADAYLPVLGVQESFLRASFDQITLSFGTMEAYITDGLKIDAATRTALRNKMLR